MNTLDDFELLEGQFLISALPVAFASDILRQNLSHYRSHGSTEVAAAAPGKVGNLKA